MHAGGRPTGTPHLRAVRGTSHMHGGLLQLLVFLILNAVTYMVSYHILINHVEMRLSVLVYGALQSLIGFAAGYGTATCMRPRVDPMGV